jgi:hypothetical protein
MDFLHTILTKHGKKINKAKKFQNQKTYISSPALHSSVDAETFSDSPTLSSVVLKSLSNMLSVSPHLIFWKYASQKTNGAQKAM